MRTKTNDKAVEKSEASDLAEALARMDAAYQKAAEGLPSLENDWEFVAIGLQTEMIMEVEKALSANGMNRASLARQMGVSRAHVSKILNEKGNFNLETIAKLSVALNRDIALRLIRKTEKVVVESARIPEHAANRVITMFEISRAEPLAPSNWHRDPTIPPSPRMFNITDTTLKAV